MSLRLRLFLLLSAATGAIWLSAVLWIEHSTRSEVEKVLDARLAEAAGMVSSLISSDRVHVPAPGQRPETVPMPVGEGYSRQLTCQIWSLQGELVGRSQGAPQSRLTAAGPGYSEALVDGEAWRVYTIENRELGVRVMVGDALEVRNNLVRDVIEGLLLPVAVILPLLAAAIWLSIAHGLAPLKRLETTLRLRSPSDLSPLPDTPAPSEIRPVRRALNRLFGEVEAARRTERDFIAFAAHELKTPIAGLRTQAQIARIATDEATRNRALRAIEDSIDRTGHMVRQLLELAAVERDNAKQERIALQELVKDAVEGLADLAGAKRVRIKAAGQNEDVVETNRFLLQAALRNLLENAIHASPAGGTVTVAWAQGNGLTSFTVEDCGPGIPSEVLHRVTEPFFRGPGAHGGGSGLGLTIAASAAQRLDGTLSMETAAEGKGQMVRLAFPLRSSGIRRGLS